MIDIDFSNLRVLQPAQEGFARGCADAVLISLALTRTNPPKSFDTMFQLSTPLTISRLRGLAKSFHMQTRSIGNFMVCQGFDGSVLFALKHADKTHCKIYPESLSMEPSLKGLSTKAKEALQADLTALVVERAAGQKIRFYNSHGYQKQEAHATVPWMPNFTIDDALRSEISQFLTLFATIYYYKRKMGLIEVIDRPYFQISLPLRKRDGAGNVIWSNPSCMILQDPSFGYKKVPALKSNHAFCIQAAKVAASIDAIMTIPASGDAKRLTLTHAKSDKRFIDADLLTACAQTYSIDAALIQEKSSHEMMGLLAQWNEK